MTRPFDAWRFEPPGEDHERTAAIVRQEHEAVLHEERTRQAADDLVTAARALHTTPSAVILSIIDDHGVTDVVKLAVDSVLDDVRTVAYARGHRDAMTDRGRAI